MNALRAAKSAKDERLGADSIFGFVSKIGASNKASDKVRALFDTYFKKMFSNIKNTSGSDEKLEALIKSKYQDFYEKCVELVHKKPF